MIVLVILFILLVLWMGKECHSLHRFNYEGQIQELQSLNEVVIKHPSYFFKGGVDGGPLGKIFKFIYD